MNQVRRSAVFIRRGAAALAAVLVICAFSFAGCKSKPTAESLLKKAESKEQSNLTMDNDSVISIFLDDDSMDFHYKSDIRQTGTFWTEGSKLHAKITTKTKEALGEETKESSQDTEMYIIPNDINDRVYLTVDGEKWTYYDQDHDDSVIYSIPEIYDDDIRWTLAEATEKVDGRDAYVLTADMAVTDELLDSSLGNLTESMAEVFTKIDKSKMSVSAKIWIDAAKDGGLLKAEFDWGDSFSADMFAGTTLEGFSAKVSDTYYNISFDGTEVELPDEILKNAAEADLTEDLDAIIGGDED